MELVSGPFCDEVFDILSAILIRTKILLQTVFWNALFQVVISVSVATLVTADFSAIWRSL